MTIVTRFAPSPTGFLHIGGARTALFNWLYARHCGGTYRLRIEDTDRKRSTREAIDAIIDGLAWLGLDHDDEIVFQSTRAEHHAELAGALLDDGKAYRCYCSPEELAEMRAAARAAGSTRLYDGRWRDRDPGDAPAGVAPVVRLKAPLDGETVIADAVQGEVRVANAQLDDMVLLRADGTPTYMLSVVVDDHDMGVTDVIRGDDHLTNAFRQTQLFRALGWPPPRFAHIPLIHGADGAKLSKRHGALGVEAYRDMGILPEALCNYLLRLGWSHGDDEIISREEAVEWFDLAAIGRSPARFDMDRLISLNAHYLRAMADERLLALILPDLAARRGAAIDEERQTKLTACLPFLKDRAKTTQELIDNSYFLVADRPIALETKAEKLLAGAARALLDALAGRLDGLDAWDAAALEGALREFADDRAVKLGDVAQPMRAALTGSTVSPGIFDVAAALGRAETVARLRDAAD